jgi:carbamoyl-phosphate synthase large subunit
MTQFKNQSLDPDLTPAPRSNILISSASRKIPLVRSIVEAKQRLAKSAFVYAGDIDNGAHAQFFCDGFIGLPKTTENNLEEILKILEIHDIGIVVPTRDGELDFWARNKAAFESLGIAVLVSDPQAIFTSIDKLAFAEFGNTHNLPIIPASEDPAGPGPFVVKERYGAGSRSIGLNLQKDNALAHATELSNPIYQPFIEGREISVDAWLDSRHKVKGLVLRDRNEVVNGESVVTTTFRDSLLESECRKVLEFLPLRGPVVLQLIIDHAGRPHIIELNARFGGASTASISVGLDIWYWTLMELNGQDLESIQFQRSTVEVRQIRVPTDIVLYDPDI